MALMLAAVNSDQQIEDHKMLKRVEYFACRRCKHRWTAQLQEMVDDPTCRKCGK